MDDRKVPTWREMLVNVFGTYGVKWLWVTIIISVLNALLSESLVGAHIPVFSASFGLLNSLGLWQKYFAANAGLTVFMLVFFAPFVEEVLFRMLPLTLVQGCRPQIVRAVLIAVCGIVFGWLHGSPLNVFIQGVGGIMLGCLYLANSRSQLTSYFSCVFVHAMYNMTVLLVAAGS